MIKGVNHHPEQKIPETCDQNGEEFLTMKEAAALLKRSLSSMQKISASRRLPVYKPTKGKVYFKKSDLINFFNNGRLRTRYEIELEATQKGGNS
jgi:hypothetical protein